MKITTNIRALIALLCLVMVFSLFACGEEISTLTDANDTDAQTDASTNESTEGDTTEETTSEKTEATTAEVTEEPTEETTEDVTTDGETTEEETTEKETEAPECQHAEEVVIGTPATCEATGLTDGKKCSVCGETLSAQQVIPALGHAWTESGVTDPDCENAGEKTFVCANDETHTTTETIPAIGHSLEWQYASNVGTEYEGTRYAVQNGVCKNCNNVIETRVAVVAFYFDSITTSNSAGVASAILQIGSSNGAMVADHDARVLNLLETPNGDGKGNTYEGNTYLRNNAFLNGTGWLGVSGTIDTENAYYRILDENGNALTDWQAKFIYDSGSNVAPQVKPEDAGSYKSVKTQLSKYGITDFTAYGFKTNNLNTKINDVEYASVDTPIAIEYAVKIADAPEGSDLIRVIVFENVYKVCTTHNCSDWQYVSNEGTEYEGTRYAVQRGTCDDCGQTVTRAAVVSFYLDSVATADKKGANNSMAAFGSTNGTMVIDPEARVTTQEAIYLRSNSFIMANGTLGVAGEIDIEKGYFRVLDAEGNVLKDWTEHIISDSSDNKIRPQVKPDTAGSYNRVKGELEAQGVTDFTAYGFRTNNLTVGDFASTDKPICVEYAVKIAGAPEGSDLIRVIVFQNVYKYPTA